MCVINIFRCAGSLISPDWVLTSAFCVTEVGTYSVGQKRCFNSKNILSIILLQMICSKHTVYSKGYSFCVIAVPRQHKRASLEMGAFLVSYIWSVVTFASAQIDAVGGDHNLLMPSIHEQIRGVDQIIRLFNCFSTSFQLLFNFFSTSFQLLLSF